jgi:nitrate reductase alpha subunit
VDHEWFLAADEALPGHKEPLSLKGHPLRFMMGHARHGIHSMWRDDPLLLSLQRGEPDIYVSPDDAAARGVADGDLIRVFNPAGEFRAQAHVSSAIQPGMLFMYHGWDPMMFRDRQNFGAVICTAGLIKPTTMAGDYGHLGYRPLAFAPNQTYKDFTCDFELAERRSGAAGNAAGRA